MATFTAQDASGSLVTTQATIASGQSLSAALDLQQYSLVGLLLPSAWTAAAVTFQGSIDGSNFFDLYDSGAEINLGAAAASRYLLLSPSAFAGLRYLKVRSGTSGTPVNQAADRALTLVLRGL